MSADSIPSTRTQQHVQTTKTDVSLLYASGVPTELWQEIFQFTIHGFGPGFPERPIEPWLISRVSKTWRDIAISSPGLWSRIILDFTDIPKSKRKPSELAEYLQTLVQRSADAPVQVSIDCPSNWNREVLKTICDIILPTSNRWEMLYVREAKTDMLQALEPIRGHLSNLRLLSVDFTSNFYTPWVSDLFNDAPRLEGVTDYSHGVVLKIPFPQLRLFKTSKSTEGQATATFSSLENVKQLQLANMDIILLPHLPLSSLTRLELLLEDRPHYEQFERLFADSIFPNLRVLVLAKPCVGYKKPLVQMASRLISPWPLKRLVVKSADEGDDIGWMELLELTPHLTSLEMNQPSEEDFSFLIAGAGQPALVPDLADVCIWFDEHDVREHFFLPTNLITERLVACRRFVDSRFGTLSRDTSIPKSLTMRIQPCWRDFSPNSLWCPEFWRKKFSGLMSRTFNRYQIWRQELHSASRDYNDYGAGRTHYIFAEIEEEDIEPQCLLVSGLHLELHRASLSLDRGPKKAPGRNRFVARSRAIMHKWAPLLYETVRHHYWQPDAMDPLRFKYVPVDSPLRSKDNFLRIIYGDCWNDDDFKQDVRRKQGESVHDCSDWEKI